MSDFLSRVSRRKFMVTAGVSAGVVFLKGCIENPSQKASRSTNNTGQSVKNLSPEQRPETGKVKLGYIPIVEAAALIIAKEKGFFTKYGMTDVELSKQASWNSARDNVEIGSASGGIDGGQWQMPMPHLISEGIITKGNQKILMYVLCQLNTHGNGIAIAKKHLGKGIGVELAGAKSLFAQMKSSPAPFTAAQTFPSVNQDFWIRYWLAAGGIDPEQDVKLFTVPPAQTVANMKTGAMDAFSTGDPWPFRIVKDKIGFLAALTADIWKYHPEEYLAMRADWVDQHPKATRALLKGIMEAQQWCDNFDNRSEMSEILAHKDYFNVPVDVLIEPFMGKYDMGEGRIINDRSMAALYWKDGKGNVSYPYKSHDLWFITESVRWRFLPADYITNKGAKAKALIDKLNREDIWKQAATEAGFSADIPPSPSRGVEKFFDGVQFDPEDPEAYLRSLQIKKVSI